MSAGGLLAVDVGTSGVRAGVITFDGRLAAFARRSYGLIEAEGPGWIEQDATEWWRAAVDSMREAVQAARPVTVEGIGLGGQGPSLVAVDQMGEPIAHALIWMDHRAEPIRRRMSERLGREVSAYSNVPKAGWLREHRRDVYDRTRWFLQAWDYVAFRLTGSAVASSFAGNPVFPEDLLAAADLDPSRFPPFRVMGEPIGAVRPDLATELGLAAAPVVAAGVNDSTATVLGAGLVREGLALDLGGTSGGIAVMHHAPVRGRGLTAWPAPTPGLFVCGGPFASAGRALPWLMAVTGYGPADYDRVEADAAEIAPGADGVVFLPYLAGERTPIWDDRARGTFFGLSERHTRGHLARSVLEGVAFSLRHVADLLRESGCGIDELRVTGGQARSALWNRIKADVLGVPVVVPAITEGALAGEAMLAAAAIGRAGDPVSMSASFVREAARFLPDAHHADAYEAAYRIYRELYPRLRELMGR